jgi:hypothetical protein
MVMVVAHPLLFAFLALIPAHPSRSIPELQNLTQKVRCAAVKMSTIMFALICWLRPAGEAAGDGGVFADLGGGGDGDILESADDGVGGCSS